MEVPQEKQYEHITGHLQYINEKIYQSFTLFIKLASTIGGGVFFFLSKSYLDFCRRPSSKALKTPEASTPQTKKWRKKDIRF